MFRRGAWVPLIPMRYRWPILALLGATPILIGLDYLMGAHGVALSQVEQAAPLWLWGWALLTAGFLIEVGYLMRWPRTTITGLHLSGVLLAVIAVGLGWELVDLGVAGGFRTAWLYLAVALASWWAALGYAMQIRGLPKGDIT